MKIDSYLPFYGNDFFQAVEGHSESVTIGYMRAIWHYWHHLHCEGLPDDDDYLRRLCRCESTTWKRTKGIIFGEFFKLVDGKWHNKKAREEYARSAENYQARVERVNKARALKSTNEVKVDNIPNNQPIKTTIDRPSGSGSGSSGGSEEGETEGKPEGHPWTREQWDAAAKNLGVDDKTRDHLWSHLESQGWRWGNGLCCQGDPRSALTRWLSKPERNAQPGATSAQGAPSGKREGWKIEKDIAAITAVRRKLANKIPFGTSIEAEKDAAEWMKTEEGKEYTRLGKRKRELEIELREAL